MDSASIISWYFNCNSNQGRFSVLISDLISGKTSKRCCNSNPLFHPPSLLNCIEWITTGLVVFQTFPEFKQRRRNLRGCQGMTFYYELTGFLSSVGIPWKIFPSFDYSPLFSIIHIYGIQGRFPCFFSYFFQLIQGKNHGNFLRTLKVDAKHSTTV